MHTPALALILVATLIGAGCASKETKTEPTTTATTKQVEAPPAPAVAKPECKPEPSAKIKSTKSKNKKTTETAPVDCEPAQPKTSAAPPAAAPAAAPAASSAKTEPGKPRVVKSRDGTFEGEIYGNIPANSKWARLQIGMQQAEVERILGQSHEVRHMPTGKAFIPFYYGTDRTRYEIVYRGQGSVSYTGGGIGGGRGVLMMINYDPNI